MNFHNYNGNALFIFINYKPHEKTNGLNFFFLEHYPLFTSVKNNLLHIQEVVFLRQHCVS